MVSSETNFVGLTVMKFMWVGKEKKKKKKRKKKKAKKLKLFINI